MFTFVRHTVIGIKVLKSIPNILFTTYAQIFFKITFTVLYVRYSSIKKQKSC